MGTFRRGESRHFHPSGTDRHRRKVRQKPAQVALRWNVQRGVVVIPKSVKAERMAQNFDIWDFTLSEEDMAEIAKLDIGHSEIVDHNNPDFVKMLHQLKVHD